MLLYADELNFIIHIYDHSFPLRSKAPKEYETRYL